MNTEIETKKEFYIKCVKCSDEISSNTHKRMIYCGCKAIYVDGCERYTRIGGDKENYIEIQK